MPNARQSRPIKGDTALIDKHGQPGGETVEDTPAPEDMTYADWCLEAEPWYIDQAAQPGWFTAYSAIKNAPDRIRNPKNPNWPGLFMVGFHSRGYVEYARNREGVEMFTTSEKSESGGSAVRLWVGVEGSKVAAA